MAAWIHVEVLPHHCFCLFNLKGGEVSSGKLQYHEEVIVFNFHEVQALR